MPAAGEVKGKKCSTSVSICCLAQTGCGNEEGRDLSSFAKFSVTALFSSSPNNLLP